MSFLREKLELNIKKSEGKFVTDSQDNITTFIEFERFAVGMLNKTTNNLYQICKNRIDSQASVVGTGRKINPNYSSCDNKKHEINVQINVSFY